MQQKNESFNKQRYGSNKQDPDGDIQSRSTIHRLYRTLLYALFRSPLHLHPQQQEQYSIRHSIIRKSKKTPFFDRNLLQLLQHFDKISLQNAPNKNMSARRYLLFPNEADVFFVGDEAGAHGAEMWGFELAVDEGAAEFCELAGEENKG